MHDVFISHSSVNRALTVAICHHLEANGIRCWYAPRDVGPGDWAEAIVNAIHSARIFVLVFSKDSNISPQVKREVGHAADSSCVIIPFRIDDTTMNSGLSYFLNSVHWLDAMTPPMERKIDDLYQCVKSILNHEPQTSGTAAAAAHHLHRTAFKGECQTIPLENISNFQNFYYPFYGSSMFSADLSSYFLMNKKTGNLHLTKISTSCTTLDDIAFHFQNPHMLNNVSIGHYDTIYFCDLSTHSIRTFDKAHNRWICQRPIALNLAAYESIDTHVLFRNYLSVQNSHYEEIITLVYDNRPEVDCLTKAITISPNGTYHTTDISQYQFTCFFSGMDRNDYVALMMDKSNHVTIFDFLAMKPVITDSSTLINEYMPDKSAGCDRLSESGRYMKVDHSSGSGVSVAVWDLLQGKQRFRQTFTRNHGVFFQHNHQLVYYNQEDYSLHIRDLMTGKVMLKLGKHDFEQNPAFLDYPFAFFFLDSLNAYAFITYKTVVTHTLFSKQQEELFKLTITDLNGKVVAQSKDLKAPLSSFHVSLHLTDDALLLFTTASDPTQTFKDGICTHIYRALYHYDSEGNLVFTQ